MGANTRKVHQGEPETDICRYAQEGHWTEIHSGAEITKAGQVQMASHGPEEARQDDDDDDDDDDDVP